MNLAVRTKSDNPGDYEVYMVISDRASFKKIDKTGGDIYILPINSFKFDGSKGLGIFECTSK